MATILLHSIIIFLIAEFIFKQWLEIRNMRTWLLPIPPQVSDLYTPDTHARAASYAADKHRFSMLASVVSLIISIGFLYMGGFASVDEFARNLTTNNIAQGLIFFAVVGLGSMLIHLPFDIYNTFIIEGKYGFNKTTTTTFVSDKIKNLLLGAVIGGALYSTLALLYNLLGENFWWAAWLVIGGFIVFFTMFYTAWLLPLFNKLTPLESGELRTAIEAYATQVSFPITNIMVMDGSKRSAKANAFFSGLGNQKSIVLFDTLIKELRTEEIIAVLAHEVGHYKRKHIYQSMLISLLQTGVLLLVFGWLAASPVMAQVLGATQNSFHLSLVTFSLLYGPLSLLIGIAMNILSRKYEYEADAYASNTYSAALLIAGLKKLYVTALGNPNVDKLYAFVHHSHPTLLQRIRALDG